MRRTILRLHLLAAGALWAAAACAQDARSWLEAQGLESADSKAFQEFEAVVAHPKGGGEDRAVIFRQGKPVWQSGPKDAEAGTHWALHSIGRDFDGDNQPDVHFSTFKDAGACCTTHHIFRLKPQVKKVASFSSGTAGGSDFVEMAGRKTPVMISADDASANAFAPSANSYFPVVVLEVGTRGRFQFATDLMQSKLPGQPPPVCAQSLATSNPWLKERCAEYATARRQARTAQMKAQLASIKSSRSSEKLTWEDYYATGVLGAVSAEMNRYTYTGHGAAAMNWLETIWPGNDAIKVRFITTLRQTQGKSIFAEDLKGLASDYR